MLAIIIGTLPLNTFLQSPFAKIPAQISLFCACPNLCESRDFIKQALIYFDSVPSD